MADEKKKLTGEQLKTDSERAKKLDDAKTALDSEELSEDELDAVAGGDYCGSAKLTFRCGSINFCADFCDKLISS